MKTREIIGMVITFISLLVMVSIVITAIIMWEVPYSMMRLFGLAVIGYGVAVYLMKDFKDGK